MSATHKITAAINSGNPTVANTNDRRRTSVKYSNRPTNHALLTRHLRTHHSALITPHSSFLTSPSLHYHDKDIIKRGLRNLKPIFANLSE